MVVGRGALPAPASGAPAAASAAGRATMLLVAGCFFLENLDGTVVVTAASSIGRSLHVRPTSVGLVITAFLLSLAVLVPVSGWLARRFGARAVFTTAIAVFTLASAGCAAAQTLPELVALRVVQGAGAAMMVPVGRLVVLAGARREDLLRVMAWITWPGLLAPVAAPLVGGLVVTHASWRWIFLLNVPLGVVALVAALLLVRDVPRAGVPRLDVTGALLLGGALAGVAWTAHLVADTPAGVGEVTAWAAGSVIACAAALRHLLRAPAPLLDVRALARVRTLRAGASGTALVWLLIGAVPFLLPGALPAALVLYHHHAHRTWPDHLLHQLASHVNQVLAATATRDPGTGEVGLPWLDAPTTRTRGAVWLAEAQLTADAGTDLSTALAVMRAHAFAHARSVDEVAADLIAGRLEAGGLLPEHRGR